MNHTIELRPGEAERLAIGVTNAGGEPRTATIRFADYQVVGSEDRFLKPGSLDRSIATWVVTRPSVSLQAGASTTIFVDVQAPTNVPSGGTYWGVVFIEPDDAVDPTEASGTGSEVDDDGDVTIRFRYRIRSAIQIVVDLPGNETPQLDLRDPVVTRTQQETVSLSVDVVNEGGRWAESSSLILDVYDTQTGTKVDSMVEQVARLYPGSTRRIIANMGNLEPGRYQLVLLVETGGDVVAATRFDLDVGSTQPSTTVDQVP